MEAMAAVTPGVAFDLSVNLESRAFIGSILEAEPSRRLAFNLQQRRREEERMRRETRRDGRAEGKVGYVIEVWRENVRGNAGEERGDRVQSEGGKERMGGVKRKS